MNYKILLVEKAKDDPWLTILKGKIKNALKEMGISDPDPNITTKTNFQDAFAAIEEQENKWDLLITDISLGSQQNLGIQLIDFASQIPIPTIAVSGSPYVTTQHISYILVDLQASYFFAKQDFDRKKFKEKVKELLLETPPSIQAVPDDSIWKKEVSIYGLGIEDREYLVNTLARLATAHPSGSKNYFRDVVKRLNLPSSWEATISDVWTGVANGDANILINWLEQRKDYPRSSFKQDYTILGAMVENILKDSNDRALLEIIQKYKLITNEGKLQELKDEYGV